MSLRYIMQKRHKKPCEIAPWINEWSDCRGGGWIDEDAAKRRCLVWASNSDDIEFRVANNSTGEIVLDSSKRVVAV